MFRDKAIQGFFANRSAPVVPVDTVVADPAEWTPVLEAIGTVYASRGIELAVEAGGVIREIGFKANDSVQAGQVLVRIADEIEQADRVAAEAAVHLAQQSLDRVSSLGDRGFSSEAVIQEAEANVSSARAQVQRIQAQIDLKVLEAPFDGEIGIPDLEAGEFVTAGTTVATLQNVDTLRVDFALPEQSRPQIEIGQAVTVSSETGSDATGFITAIEPRIDPSTRLTAIRAELDNREGVLSPGQFVRVRIALPTEDDVISLPQTAVVTSLYGDYVFVVTTAEDGEDAGQIAKQVFVKTGARIAGLVQVVDGVEAGDRVVIAGQNRLSNGSPVVLSGEAQAAPAEANVEAPASEDSPADAPQSDVGAAQAAEADE
jgi:membrane fusion protein (multidrug efflux system)